MARNDGSQVPTCWQAQTLGLLIDGWELLITEWCDAAYQIMLEGATEKRRKTPSRERIYWRKHNPKFKLSPWDTMDCGNPKMKRHQMSHLERYGWVIRSDTGWTITDAGRAAHQRYNNWFEEATKKLGVK